MESLYQYIPYLIVAAISWATSSRSNWWIPFLDQINPEPVPVAGLLKRRSLDTILKIVWPFLGDKKIRDIVRGEALVIAKALDDYKVPPLVPPGPPA